MPSFLLKYCAEYLKINENKTIQFYVILFINIVILMKFPLNVERTSMEMTIAHFKGSHIEMSKVCPFRKKSLQIVQIT